MTVSRLLAWASLPALLVACSAHAPSQTGQPPNWDAELRLPEAVDMNPDPHVFETTLVAQVVDLEIVSGKITPVWTYNGLLPGPLIRVARGDRLIVHLVNQLPEATTLHWHGIRVPNAMDGVPGVTQPAVEPGGSFDYDFTVPDAGTYWYHPHVDSAAQVGYGLYGPIVVIDPDEPAGLGDELVLVVSDMQLTDDGSQLSADAGGDLPTLFGREGETLLVNGKVNPTLRARARGGGSAGASSTLQRVGTFSWGSLDRASLASGAMTVSLPRLKSSIPSLSRRLSARMSSSISHCRVAPVFQCSGSPMIAATAASNSVCRKRSSRSKRAPKIRSQALLCQR